ncbi:MAG: UDP-N-acetylglucosamine--N-acetylmuramyl-(pentapeptide) pyrophosphoryl-undecaprenol N-acetylglucosamine transferase, partial [Deltaproteobacteria bacterium]|nr:UDP-N-acetylglucosamine--N-acetylmuramyl-(pentapeptide) pyrophosphoryl-undecaprenol N-acetylglucosamine transferase [Deltaproteobacteria bacterium]
MTGPRLLFGAGGTGGHLIPALAVARALRLACPEVDILFAGVGRPAEAELLDPEGWPRVVLAGQGFKGGSFKSKVGSLKSAFVGLGQALKLIRSFKPRLFFGAGGYVTGPVGLAAWLNFKPVVIHEQNSRPGLTNRLLAKVAKEIFVGFPEGLEAFSPDKAVLTGNPLRTEIAALFERKLNYNVRDRFVLLIMGGSQGANRLNVAALDLVAQLAEAGLDFEVIHQTGAKDEAKIDSFYSRLGIKRETKAFFKDPERLYQKAHLAITRAGALTVTELAAVGLPAILVPLPTAADDH